MNPGITLATIVKDDAVRLRRCLDSVRDVVAAMVVVDTGSTDNSADVAAEMGARVLEIEWPNAFDVALNVALDAVDTAWTIRLDSDEWFEAADAEALRTLSEDDGAFAYFMTRRDRYDDRPDTEITSLRMWRTDPNLRYRGAVHEAIPWEAVESARGAREVKVSDVRFQHDGYTGGVLPAKRKRNLALLEEELHRDPDNLYYLMSRAELLVAEGDPAGTREAARLADVIVEHSEPEALPALAAWVVGIAIELVPDAELFDSRTERLIRYALRHQHRSPTAMWGVANLQIRRGAYHHAYHALLELEDMAETGRFDRGIATPVVFLEDGPWTLLGQVAQALGKREVARRNFMRLLRKHPGHPLASAQLRTL